LNQLTNNQESRTIIVIGGGAAGFFGAIACAEANPNNEVIIVEKTTKLLSKVKVSGGGRCNVTHACFDEKILVQHYPRGNKALMSPFSRFQPKDTIGWFSERGVEMHTEEDGRMFPVTNNSQTIIYCLMAETERLGIKIWTGCDIDQINKKEKGFDLVTSTGQIINADKVLIAAGGNAKLQAYKWLQDLGHTIEEPVPSLFTFNIIDNKLRDLLGLSVNDAIVKVQGTKLESRGPLLITHWGLSGPAVLKLSAWGARILQTTDYDFNASVCWLPDYTDVLLTEKLQSIKTNENRKQIATFSPFTLSLRLWKYIIYRSGIDEELRWADISKKQFNKLIEELLRGTYHAQGKTTFKEEFVTCGGISLKDIDFKTMESKVCKGLYFAGEVIDVDGITGGFNFQNAWTTAFIAGNAISSAVY
jgi:predicted Rossmann fold flavoprotein